MKQKLTPTTDNNYTLCQKSTQQTARQLKALHSAKQPTTGPLNHR